VYTNVALRNWQPFVKGTLPLCPPRTHRLIAVSLCFGCVCACARVCVCACVCHVTAGVHEVFGVNTFHSRIKLDYPVSLGGYHAPTSPDSPILVHMVHVPHSAEADPRVALKKARSTLFASKFEDFEAAARADLTAILGPYGFDAQRDIAGIVVNRWSHGNHRSLPSQLLANASH
jgi:hypothetical protein